MPPKYFPIHRSRHKSLGAMVVLRPAACRRSSKHSAAAHWEMAENE
jgi:hypothetical protein